MTQTLADRAEAVRAEHDLRIMAETSRYRSDRHRMMYVLADDALSGTNDDPADYEFEIVSKT